MNRGVAKRSMFESPGQVEFLLGLVERVVEEGLLEVLVFTVLGSHFHMLVRSPLGRLSEAMQRIESPYCLWFNRVEGRQGPLVTGRFVSKRVEDERYRQIVTGYIDWNPVDAGSAESPDEYPYGSAWHYVRPQRPAWLATEWLDRELDAGPDGIDRDVYRAFSRPSSHQAWVVEARLRVGDLPTPEELMSRGPVSRAARWFRERAELADRGSGVLPVASPSACDEAVRSLSSRLGEFKRAYPRRDLQNQLRIGAITQICGLSATAVSAWVGLPLSTASRHLRRHREMILECDGYANLCAEAARLAIDLTFGEA